MRRLTNGLPSYHFQSLEGQALVHAIFTRLGGTSQGAFATLNVGRSVGDDQSAVAENLERIYAALGLGAEQVTTPHQVHGNRVAVVDGGDAGRILSGTDGLVTDTPGLALLLRFADCQPIVLYDPARHALGLVHAGWRGLALAIARRAVETMEEAFGTRPSDVLVGLGPAIGPCCYTVGDEVASAMGYALPDWQAVMQLEPAGAGWRLDLPAANAQQLVAAGVPARQVEQAALCTGCHNDTFFSHRADQGTTGRFAVVAYLLPKDGARRAQAQEPAQQQPTDGVDALPDTLHPPGLPDLGEMLG